MARKANDGTEYTNQMGVNRRNASLAAKGDDSPSSPAPSQPNGDPGPLQSNPQAMDCVNQLKQMGYTPDDVAAAMGDQDQGQGMGQSSAPAAQPLSIPGMG